MNSTETVKFLYEMGQLRRVKREGWRLIGVEHPESVAEHSLRAAQIAWILARMENHPNPAEVALIVVFHDIGECRVGDLHKLANRYGSLDEVKAIEEQVARLGAYAPELMQLIDQMESKSTPAGVIAKDADLLELAVRAREYIEQGFTGAEEWYKNASQLVKTKSAKELIELLPQVSSNEWWHGLKKLDTWPTQR